MAVESLELHSVATTHSTPIRGRINAAFFASMDWYMHWKYGTLKRRLFRDLPHAVVEIGAGVGANVRYLSAGTKLIAIEPNHHMHAQLERRASRRGVELEIHASRAEALDLPDESVDAVVCTLVLCTVDDPDRVLAEVRRVLRPGGRLICIEHVAASPGSFIGWLQRLVFRPWRWFFEGCHTHRDTTQRLREAGFSAMDVAAFTIRTAFLPIRPQIAAVCTK
jgi:ubiquinone/menaquinone biosynthesis C-methylase UbiE